MGIEPTWDSYEPHTDFEDQGHHQEPVTSNTQTGQPQAYQTGRASSRVAWLHADMFTVDVHSLLWGSVRTDFHLGCGLRSTPRFEKRCHPGKMAFLALGARLEETTIVSAWSAPPGGGCKYAEIRGELRVGGVDCGYNCVKFAVIANRQGSGARRSDAGLEASGESPLWRALMTHGVASGVGSPWINLRRFRWQAHLPCWLLHSWAQLFCREWK
jgi:hypothetical protein